MLHPSAIWGTIFSTLVSADVQVFSMVFTFGACSSSILGAHHTGDRGGARTLDPCISSFVLIPRFIFASRLSDRGCWGKPRFSLINCSQNVHNFIVNVLKNVTKMFFFIFRSLQHENLVCLRGMVIDSDTWKIVTEYMSKGSLLEYLRSRGRQYVTKSNQIKFAL